MIQTKRHISMPDFSEQGMTGNARGIDLMQTLIDRIDMILIGLFA